MRTNLTIPYRKSTPRGRGSLHNNDRETVSLEIEIPEAEPSEVSRPYRISRASIKEPNPHWLPEIILDVLDTIEYRGRCWMPLTYDQPDKVAKRTLDGLMVDYVRCQIGLRDLDLSSGKVSAKAVEESAARLTSDMLIHDGKVFIPDAVPIFAVDRGGQSNAHSIQIIPSRWIVPSHIMEPAHQHLYSEEEKGKAAERYHLIGGRKRFPEIEKLTKTRFDVDIYARQLRTEVDAMLGDLSFNEHVPPGFFQSPWAKRLLGSDALEITRALFAVATDQAAGPEDILEIAEPYARILRDRIVADPIDRLFDSVDAILDVGQRFRAAAARREADQEPAGVTTPRF